MTTMSFPCEISGCFNVWKSHFCELERLTTIRIIASFGKRGLKPKYSYQFKSVNKGMFYYFMRIISYEQCFHLVRRDLWPCVKTTCDSQQTQNICITFMQRWPNVCSSRWNDIVMLYKSFVFAGLSANQDKGYIRFCWKTCIPGKHD